MQQKIFNLTNGLKVVLVNLPESLACTASLYLPAGYKYDPLDKPGLAHISEHIMLAGTQKYPTSKDLDAATTRFGGLQTAFTWIDYQLHTVRLPKDKLENGIDVLQQTTRYPLLKNVELQKEKQSVIEEIHKDRSEPSMTVWDYAWNEAFWKGSSLARPYTGDVNDLNNISITDVQKFIDEISFNKGVFCISGNFDTNYALNIVEKYFGDIKDKRKSATQEIKPHNGGSLKILPNNTENTYLMFGFKTIKKDHKDTYTLRLISRLLGGSFSGILVNKLREKGFIYDWILDQDLLQETGYIYFKTSTSRKFLNDTIKQICDSFKKVANGKVSKEEFEIAQSQTIGELLLNIETTMDYNGWYGEQEFLSGKSYTPQEIAKIYKKITINSVAEVAKKYFTANNWYLGLVGKAEPREIEDIINLSLSLSSFRADR